MLGKQTSNPGQPKFLLCKIKIQKTSGPPKSKSWRITLDSLNASFSKPKPKRVQNKKKSQRRKEK